MKIFYAVLAFILLLCAVAFLNAADHPSGSMLVFIPLLMFTGGILIVVSFLRRKIVIYPDSIIYISLFRTREIQSSEIRGCRIEQKTIYIEPVNTITSRIMIGNYIDFADSAELVTLLQARFKDLDAADLEVNHDVVLHDARLGATEAERETSLKKAKQVSVTYDIIGFLLPFLFINNDGKLSTAILIAYPLLAIVIMALSKGLIKFVSDTKKSVYPYLFPGILLPSFILLIRAMRGNNYLSLDHIYVPALSCAALTAFLYYITGLNRAFKSMTPQVIAMIIIAMLYGFGTMLEINVVFDNPAYTTYNAVVLDHRIDHGKNTSYYLTITPWGPCKQTKHVEVHRSIYQRVQIGDTINVNYRNGYLHVPWFRVFKD